MAQNTAFIIAGAGLAGAKAAEALRAEGFDGPVLLLGEERERPYERPPLSKGYLLGTSEKEKVYVHPPQWYAQHDVDLRTGNAVTALDPAAHEVTLADGSRLGYAKLLLATGSTPRTLPVPGADLDGVHTLRRLADSDRLKGVFRSASRIVVIGGGWIGLETAAAARAAGVEVTVLESAPLPLLGVLGREVAQIFADLHTGHGVALRCDTQVTEITGTDGAVDGVRLADGTRIAADAVIVGIGITPNSEPAAAAGLKVDNGVVVDERLCSSHPDIHAAGDVANAYHPLLGKHLRVEHWANALHQPATAARAMLGREAVYDRLPYFFTDQYDLGMEYTGHVEPGGYDRVVFRGDTAAREFIAFWLSGGRVLAGMNVNVWDVTEPIRALVASGRAVDPERLADTDVPLEELLP
ncbi:NAD(P)/FAD-dependent oxidoreductase [Streptomyces angustmyceticus]|uniref:NAD(P)/FAD-dependent oxidoreductase n=1 Tax=Streptomyces angustmyceticus TaxID=285578 RepID=UPI0037F632AE